MYGIFLDFIGRSKENQNSYLWEVEWKNEREGEVKVIKELADKIIWRSKLADSISDDDDGYRKHIGVWNKELKKNIPGVLITKQELEKILNEI